MSRETDARAMLLDGHCCPNPPVTTWLPFPYHWIPGSLRMRLANWLAKPNVQAVRADGSRRPTAYADNSADHLVASCYQATADLPVWSWPGGKRCALALSHDTDTAGQERGIDLLRRVAADCAMRSCFSFVGDCLDSYRGKADELLSGGCTIALHDMKHDNRIAFLAEDQIVERLRPAAPSMRALAIRGFRSPSWYTSRALWSALQMAGFDYDMSALDSWPLFDRTRNYGVASFFPYLVGDLAILPTTIPFEHLRTFGYRLEDALPFWRPKFDFIARSGGLILFNAHPDRWFSGNPTGAKALAACLDYILKNLDPACMTPDQVAEHTRQQRDGGAMIRLSGDPAVLAPRHRPDFLSTAPSRAERNPCRVTPKEFLSASIDANRPVYR